jgi:hypothetical protein
MTHKAHARHPFREVGLFCSCLAGSQAGDNPVGNQPGSVLNHRAGSAIESKGSRHRVGAVVPGAIEAGLRSQGLTSRDRAIIRSISNRDVTPALRIAAIPELGNRLAIGKRELERPAVNGRGPCVRDGKAPTEAARPLARNGIVD